MTNIATNKSAYPSLNIVWDITRLCPMNCAICCMDATAKKCEAGQDLNYQQKMEVVEQIVRFDKERPVSVDIAGGEPLLDLTNLDVIEHLSEKLGKAKVDISSSGYNITSKTARRIADCVHGVEMTMDTIPGLAYPLRPKRYAEAAAAAIPYLLDAGLEELGIQTVLARSNFDRSMLEALYVWLNEHHVHTWSLLAFFPSGRGKNFPEEKLTQDEKAQVVDFLKKLDDNNHSDHKVKLDFHFTLPGSPKPCSCRCVSKSIGILPDGHVTGCFWAIGCGTKILDPYFELGVVPKQELTDILHSEKAIALKNYNEACSPEKCLGCNTSEVA